MGKKGAAERYIDMVMLQRMGRERYSRFGMWLVRRLALRECRREYKRAERIPTDELIRWMDG